MNLNPGQWTFCHALKCKSLKDQECAEEKCTYGTERDKFRALQAQGRARFMTAIANDKARKAEIKAQAIRTAEALGGGR